MLVVKLNILQLSYNLSNSSQPLYASYTGRPYHTKRCLILTLVGMHKTTYNTIQQNTASKLSWKQRWQVTEHYFGKRNNSTTRLRVAREQASQLSRNHRCLRTTCARYLWTTPTRFTAFATRGCITRSTKSKIRTHRSTQGNLADICTHILHVKHLDRNGCPRM